MTYPLPFLWERTYSGRLHEGELLFLDAFPGETFSFRLGPLGGRSKFIVVKRLRDGRRFLVDWPMQGEPIGRLHIHVPILLTPKHYLISLVTP